MASLAARRNIASLLNRILNSSSSSSSSSSLCSLSRFIFPLLNQGLLPQLLQNPLNNPARFKTSRSGYSPLNDPSPNWSNRPPKETILLDGCDYEHWLVVMEFPTDPKPSEEEMVNTYVKTLASLVGRYCCNLNSIAVVVFKFNVFFSWFFVCEFFLSEEEAKKKIYSVSTKTYTGFGALISEELSYKLKGMFFFFFNSSIRV